MRCQLWSLKTQVLKIHFRSLKTKLWDFLLSKFEVFKFPSVSFASLVLADDVRLFELLDKQLKFHRWQLLLYPPSEDDGQSQLSFWLRSFRLSVRQPITVLSWWVVVLVSCAVLLLYRLNYSYSEWNCVNYGWQSRCEIAIFKACRHNARKTAVTSSIFASFCLLFALCYSMIKMTFQAYILGYIYWISTYDAKQILWASLFAQYDVDIISFYPIDLNCVFWTHTACLAYGNAEAYLCCIYHKLAKCDGKRAVLGRRNSLPGRILPDLENLNAPLTTLSVPSTAPPTEFLLWRCVH